jgi:preprotein translocase subunit SecG
MAVLPVLAVSIAMKFVGVLFILVSILMVLVILIQKGRGGGLSGAFGGGMAGGVLGSKTGDFFTWLTIGLVGLFLLLAAVMAKYYRNSVSVQTAPSRRAAPATTETTPEANAPSVPVAEANKPATPAPTTPAPAATPGANAPAATPTPAPAPAARTPDANRASR